MEDKTWLTPPFYHQPSPTYVDCGPFFGHQPTAETMMRVLAAALLGWPNGFMWGAAGSGAETPDQLTKQIIDYAVSLANPDSPQARLTAAGFDPQERGAHYAELVIDTLKNIHANAYDWTRSATASVYDVWVSKVGSGA